MSLRSGRELTFLLLALTTCFRIRIKMAAERLFIINEKNIEQMLLADNSDDENNLLLDDEDVNFLEEDVDKTGEEVIIERPVPVPAPAQIVTTAIVPTPYPSQSV